MFLISDNNDTLAGMRLSGVNGVVLHEKAAVESELERLFCDKDIGIILITEKLFDLTKDRIQTLKSKRQMPLLIKVPDRRSTVRHNER